jgi:hypothetical protein
MGSLLEFPVLDGYISEVFEGAISSIEKFYPGAIPILLIWCT